MRPVERVRIGLTVTSTSWPRMVRNSISRPTDTETVGGAEKLSGLYLR
jgi:hypothetical protein